MDVSVGPYLIRLIDEDDRIVDHLRRKDNWEPQTREFIGRALEALPADRLVLDVGAYTGLYGLAAAASGHETMLFEPNPTCHRRLVDNVHLNTAMGRLRVTPRPVTLALSDAAGEATLYGKRGALTSGGSLRASGAAGGPLVIASVKTTRLDDLTLRDLGLVKIDAEHHEAEILRGARVTLARDRPILIIEALTVADLQAIKNEVPEAYVNSARLDGRNYVFTV